MTQLSVRGVEVHGAVEDRASEVLSNDAVEFVALLHREFNPRRRELLARRAEAD